MNGYRSMISDNIPKTWDLALRVRKCRTSWIEYIYNTYIKPLNTNVMASKAENNRMKSMKVKLYTNKTKVKMKFIDTIKQDVLSNGDFTTYLSWKEVNRWADFFSEYMAYIESSYDIYVDFKGYTKEKAISTLSKRYNVDPSIVELIINYKK